MTVKSRFILQTQYESIHVQRLLSLLCYSHHPQSDLQLFPYLSRAALCADPQSEWLIHHARPTWRLICSTAHTDWINTRVVLISESSSASAPANQLSMEWPCSLYVMCHMLKVPLLTLCPSNGSGTPFMPWGHGAKMDYYFTRAWVTRDRDRAQ